MQRRGTSRHVCIYTYIVAYWLIILESRSLLHFIFYPFQLHVHKHFKYHYNHWHHLVFKYVFNYVGIGPLVLEHTIHQQRLCTLSKKVVIWHPFTVLFMIFNFKNDLLLIKILKILKKIACENKFINFRYLKNAFDSEKRIKAVTRAPPSVPGVLNYAISYVRLIYVVL